LKSIKAFSSDDSEVLAILVFLVESFNVNSQIIQDAVDGIDRLFSKTLEPYQSTTTWYGNDDPGAEGFLWMLWGVLLDVARKVPYNHPKQEVLVDFLKRLHQKEAGTIRIWGVRSL
jgi:hypothetical protein